MVNKDARILVVMGGMSTEREVSLRSGTAVWKALHQLGYINAEKFVLSTDNVKEILEMKPDYVFLALHGKWGEDGTIQGMLELAKIPFTGSGVACSAICINKILTKQILSYHGIRTPKFLQITQYDEIDTSQLTQQIAEKIGIPVVVKASCQGSSVGVKIINDKNDLPGVIAELMEYDGELLFEQYMTGKELTVPIIRENGKIRTLPIIEITSENSFYDFESKYTAGLSHHIIPARISDSIQDEINRLAIATYQKLNCRGIVRVDFMIDANGDPNVIEVNTLPGMTETSLVPDAAKAVGLSFEQIVETILNASTEDI